MTRLRYPVLASDYDGTLAREGVVARETITQLVRWRGEGGKIVLVTGRELGPLQDSFARIDLCDLVVGENGGLLFWPSTGKVEILGARPPAAFLEALAKHGVAPLSVGHCIVATFEAHLQAVRNALSELRLPHQVILNKDAVMVLPPGIDKGSGLRAALRELGVASGDCVAVGDAENDLALFEAASQSAAVSNAIASVMARAKVKLARPDGEGVSELLKGLIEGSLSRTEVA